MTSKLDASWSRRIALGVLAGAVISYIDNQAFGGEASPILIVILLLLVGVVSASVWGRRGIIAALACWVCIPLAHLVKHSLHLPDTLQPNSYRSIAYLAAFSLVITAAGAGAGLLICRFGRGSLR